MGVRWYAYQTLRYICSSDIYCISLLVRTGSELTDPTAPRPSLGEAHGGYTFCATASWALLRPYLTTHYARADSLPPTINMKTLLRWQAEMQGTHAELGGFRGRTNKLVDGCYSWWVGGCFLLVEGLLELERYTDGEHSTGDERQSTVDDRSSDEWDDADGTC